MLKLLLLAALLISGGQGLDPANVEDTKPQQATQMEMEHAPLYFKDVNNQILASGEDLVPGSAKVEMNNAGQYFVSVKFKDPNKLEELTTKTLGQTLSIYYGDKLLASPKVNQVIKSDSAQITGGFTKEAAEALVKLINSGTKK